MMLESPRLPPLRLAAAKLALGALAVAAMQMAGALAAEAGVVVKGNANALRLDVDKAPISEVLAALKPAFDVHYRTEVPLDADIDGSYRGSLKRVIARILQDYSYFVRRDGKDLEIVIFAEKTEPSVSPDMDPYQARRRQRVRRHRNN